MLITNDCRLHEDDAMLARLETYYQELTTKLHRDYPEAHVVLCAKLITTRLEEEEIAMTKRNCLDISRKIKAVKETSVLLGIDLDKLAQKC
ncbi:hypothetical protein FACS1894193_13310 [Bacilli bacterium]|nr:hypothetical protein FACS1894193_13310 [Bacilli bacterium]